MSQNKNCVTSYKNIIKKYDLIFYKITSDKRSNCTENYSYSDCYHLSMFQSTTI